MNINLLGIKISPASGALFRSEWREHRAAVLLFIGEVFCTWVLILGGVVLSLAGVALMEPAAQSPDQVVALSLGMPYSVFSFRLAISVLMLAVPATALRILHHFYCAAELEYCCITDYLDARRPEVRRHLEKCQRRREVTQQRDFGSEGGRDGVSVISPDASDNEDNKS
ncbi:TPA: hypothetical protein KEU15_002679 [Serratia marcescens]|nr:hypothetical protein [Serratia marcescens]